MTTHETLRASVLKGALATGLAAVAMIAASPAFSHPPIADRGEVAENEAFEADRADILAMAGNFKVRFDMQESTPWRTDYEVVPPKVSGGNEVVRVIEDTGRKIVLQHMLVIEHEGETHIIKHWRQDWEYEPARVLVYSDTNAWAWEDVPERMRHGRWSQTVYQVDDSPRYGAWGEWETQGGIRRWRSNWTWRPLARRDAVRDPIYDRYYSINRHQPTPTGWVHWQDNIKMTNENGELAPVVQEYVLNTYTRFDGYNVAAADEYWAKTADYWAAVRTEWDKLASSAGGIRVNEEAETGTVISARLLTLADEITEGTTTTQAAIAEAQKLIAGDSSRLASARVAAGE